MGCCGGDNDGAEEKGVAEKRSCTDILWLIVFLLFWIGMFIVFGTAVSKGSVALVHPLLRFSSTFSISGGNMNRLVYGYDSSGFLCGTKNDFQDGIEGPDLSKRKKLYYLNALDLLNPSSISSAKSICVEKCPTETDECAPGEICTDANQYRCPYYRIAEEGLYSNLDAGVGVWDTQYYGNLSEAAGADSGACGSYVSGLPSSVTDPFDFGSGATACGRYYQVRSLYPGRGPCYPVWTPTVDYFNRCFPKFNATLLADTLSIGGDSNVDFSSKVSSLKDNFGGSGERLQRYVGDISKGWLIIVVSGLVMGILLSMIWMTILRYCAGVMAWMTVAFVNILVIVVTLLAYERSGLLGEAGELGATIAEQIPEDQDPTDGDRKLWMSAAYVLTALAVLLLLFTIIMIPRIRIAVATIKVASQAIATMPSILLFPIFPFIVEVLLVLYFVFVSALLYSAGDLVPKFKGASSETDVGSLLSADGSVPSGFGVASSADDSPPAVANVTRLECATDPDCYYGVEWDNALKYMFLYHLFGLLWTNQFIVGFGYVSIAGAVANFYWNRGDVSAMPAKPVTASVKRTLFYHLGSIAFGAFLVAVIQFIRFIVEVINHKTKKMQQENAAIKYIMRCVRCCLWCLEKIMKFINRNTYIMVAVKGTSYCRSAGRAVSLIITNALRLAAVNTVGDAVIWLAKITVTAACGVTAFLMADLDLYTNEEKHPDTFLSSPIFPVLVSLLVGYVVADLFFGVYEMTVDTILLSFCEDCESNGGNPKFAPPLLLEAIGKSRERQEAKGKEVAET